MRGSLVHRGKNRWAVVLDMGYVDVVDPATGTPVVDPVTGIPKRKRMQKWISVRGDRDAADTKLTELVKAYKDGEFVEPNKVTLGEWLTKWLIESVKPALRSNTYEMYKGAIEHHLSPALGSIPLQKLRPSQIKQYYLERTGKLSGATLAGHHAVLNSALKSAVRNSLVTKNVATLVDGRPRPKNPRHDAKIHCWTLDETRTFLAAAKAAGPQAAALFALTIDSGMRRGELCGLKWSDVDLDAGKVRVDRQLLKSHEAPIFGPTKTGAARTVDINDETIRLLREHKRHQSELKMKNRRHYNDYGLVFAREWADIRNHESLGLQLNGDDLGFRIFGRLVKAAKVRRIRFHGLRHTCATLLLGAGVPVHVVSQRLGHSNPTVTMNVYAHCLPSHQQDAAAKLGALLNTGS